MSLHHEVPPTASAELDDAVRAAASETYAYESVDQYYRPGRLKRTAIAAVLAIGLAGEQYASNSLIIPEIASDMIFQSDAPAFSSEIDQRVERLLDQPRPQDLNAINTLPEEVQDRAYELFSLNKAEEAGLTAYDPEPYRQPLAEATSLIEATDKINDYTRKMGFTVTLHNTIEFSDIGWDVTPLDSSKVNLEEFKVGGEMLLGALALMPKEINDLAGVNEVRIVDSLGEHSDNDGVAKTAGEANVASGILYVPIDQVYKGDYTLYMHEISHRLDYKTTGGLWSMFHDSRYMALNPAGFEYGDPNNPYIGDAVAQRYGAKNVVEDKAVMYQSMINGLNASAVYSNEPSIRNKYRFLVKVLEKEIPGTARYYFAISGGNDKDQVEDILDTQLNLGAK